MGGGGGPVCVQACTNCKNDFTVSSLPLLAAINHTAGPSPCHSVLKGAAHSVVAGSISELCGYHCVAPLAPPDMWGGGELGFN